MSEWCERMSERRSEWPSTLLYASISYYSKPLRIPRQAFPNCYFGLTNMVGFRGSWTKPTRDLAMRIPLKDLLLETDAPFMVPNLPPDVPNYSVPGMALCVAQSIAGWCMGTCF